MSKVRLEENAFARDEDGPMRLFDPGWVTRRPSADEQFGYGSGSAAVLIHNTTPYVLSLTDTATDAQWGLPPAQTVRPHQRSLHLIMRSTHRPHRVTLKYQVSMTSPDPVPLASVKIDCELPSEAAAQYALTVVHTQQRRRLAVRQHPLNAYTVAFTLCELRF